MSYVVYETADGDLISAERTEAAADTTVAAGTGRAKSGEITLPDDFKLHQFRWDTTNNVLARRVIGDLTDAARATILKDTVMGLAVEFDAGLRFHWAGQGSENTQRPTDRITDEVTARRYNNTDVWGRAWIGIAWRECDRLENAHASAMSLANVQKIVAQAKAEIQNRDHVGFWYVAHDDNMNGKWKTWLIDATGNGGADNRVFYRTTSTGDGAVFTDPTLSVSPADWSDIIDEQYFECFKAARVAIG